MTATSTAWDGTGRDGASRDLEVTGSENGEIVLVGAEEHLPYDRPPLSKAFLDAGGPGRVQPFHPETVLRDELGVEHDQSSG